MLAEHRAVLREAFGAHGGAEVDTQGDAFFFTFAQPGHSVAAALAAQAALADGPVRVRMGVHTGEPTRTDEGWVGVDVHLGARVAAAGHGGQVLLTKATRDLLAGEAVRDLGEHRVKDFDHPVWIYQLGDEPFPPLKTISNTNLPRPASSFVGREREVAEVQELARGSRLVTLTGPGGSGKTRLSIEAASELVGDFKNGVFWVLLATIHDPMLVMPTVAKAIGAQGDLAEHVGERELLLVLDNLEQVIDAAPELAALVEACPNVHLIVTSRELLRVRGEVEYEVLPLADPEAVELFTSRAQLEPTATIEELCRRLDNMPLALELAAARTKALAPEEILDRLGGRLDLFKGGRDAEARQRTLRATIEWSHDLLTPEEQELFAKLGAFAGGCTIAGAETVAGADLDTLQSLVEKSLLRHTDERFWMLETIREYAAERLEEREDAGALRQAYAEFFLALAESAGLCVESLYAGRPERRELVLPEAANLRAALDWAAERDPELGLRLAVALEQFWVTQDPDEAVRRLDVLLARAEAPPTVLRGSALRVLGGMAHSSWQLERAIAASEEALELYRGAGDQAGETLMLFRLGTSYLGAGEMVRARALLEESLAGFRRQGNRVGECEAGGNLASLEAMHGDPKLGQELLEQNVELARELGWRWWEASKLLHLAEHALGMGNVGEGEKRAAEGLEIERELANRRIMVFGLAITAWAAARRDDAGRAGMLWGAIEAEVRRVPSESWESERPLYVARLEHVAGPEFDQARAEGARFSLDEAVEYALAGRNEPSALSGEVRP